MGSKVLKINKFEVLLAAELIEIADLRHHVQYQHGISDAKPYSTHSRHMRNAIWIVLVLRGSLKPGTSLSSSVD